LKVLALKLMPISLKRNGAAVDAKLWQTRRRAGRVLRSTFLRRAFLQSSDNQNRRKAELEDNTRLQTELFEKLAVEDANQKLKNGGNRALAQ